MEKQNYDAIRRVKDLEERDKRRSEIASKYVQTVIPVQKAKELEFQKLTLINITKKKEAEELRDKKALEDKRQLKDNYMRDIHDQVIEKEN